MVAVRMMTQIDATLKFAEDCRSPFVGVSWVFLRGFSQTRPVGDTSIAVGCREWLKVFHVIELIEIMQQRNDPNSP